MVEKKIKILHITTLDLTAYVFLLPLLDALKKEGWEIELACTETKWVSKIREKGFKVNPVYIARNISPVKDFISLRQLGNLIKDKKYDIVHTHTSKAGFLGRLAAAKAKTPLILHTCHGLAADSCANVFQKKLYIWFEKLAAVKSHHVIAVSEAVRRGLVNNSIISSNKATTIHNGIDLTRFKVNKPKDLIKRELGLPDTEPVIGIIGRLEKQKGHFCFIKAAKEVIKKNPKSIFVIVGTGCLKNTLKQLVDKLGLEKHIYFLGYRDSVAEILSILDVFIYPSLWEGFGMGVLEAMAAGTPVVASRVGGILDLIEDKKDGLLVAKGNHIELADGILELLSDKNKANQLAQRAKLKAENNFSQDKLLIKYIELYKELIEKYL